MTLDELKERVCNIITTDQPFGLELYACVKELGNTVLKKIQVTENLEKELSNLIRNAAEELLLPDDAELDSVLNISDNRKILYEIPQTETYCPFLFLEDETSKKECYTEANQEALVGYAFRVNKNDEFIWLYQHLYPIKRLTRSHVLYAILSDGITYKTLDKDIFRIDPRIDIAIIDGSIITSKIDLLQKNFGFDQYIKRSAKETINTIRSMGLVKNVSMLEELLEKNRLADAKKLMKAHNSPVFSMKQSTLCKRLKKHSRYKDKFKYDGDMIIIETQKTANDFLKMLNDDIVKSELTEQEYDSQSKKALPPLK